MIFVITAATIVVTDLLTGVVTGIVLSVFNLVHSFARLSVRLHQDAGSRHVTVRLRGIASFVRLPKLAAKLEAIPPETEVHVDATGLRHIDLACQEMIHHWQEQHEATGGKVTIAWHEHRRHHKTSAATTPTPTATTDDSYGPTAQ